MKRTIANITICSAAALAILGIGACQKMDEYKKFAEGGEITYPSTFDSLKVIAGNNRAMITGILKGDPKVTRYRVFWNSGRDSLETTMTRSGEVDTIKQVVPNLPEGPITFTLRTYDAKGNKSIPMIVTGNVYGASFQSSVDQRGNRVVLSTKYLQDGSAVIKWANVDAYVGVFGMQIIYQDGDNKQRDTIVPVKLQDQETTVPNVGIKQALSYKTLYLPEAVGIDTFRVAAKTLGAFTEVSLLNSIKPIANAGNDGSRWANMRDWITNSAAKNHNGYGGTDIGGDPKIYFEAGWGAGAIQNGKIHQVVTLPPGKYKFEGSVDWWHRSNRNDVYLMAVPGAGGLPNIDNLGAAISYGKLEGGWWWDTQFELTQKTTLSIGMLLYMSDQGEATRLNSLRLYIVN
ncbi:DUF4998 domain-containing protein [Paraflavitalea sp. CAU 1676]|uniref:DUF4998 domain-containing protein n=1 Tax=Paraflavitalea sp. CAU 1676 TaxID=3032598 RepID=UPI0023DB5620|nr:DUF4998 domain-containing protein [Paraflavitalea sp. CAU 1676]MDF2188276.1 DUF4998 domain-containing protein [Paraflavitalea sp. CAU 1676]